MLLGLLLAGCRLDPSVLSETRTITGVSRLTEGDNVWIVDLDAKEGPMWMIFLETRKTALSWRSRTPGLSANQVTVSVKNTGGAALLVVRGISGERNEIQPGESLQLYAGSLGSMTHGDGIAYLLPAKTDAGLKTFGAAYVIRSEHVVELDTPVPLVAYRSP